MLSFCARIMASRNLFTLTLVILLVMVMILFYKNTVSTVTLTEYGSKLIVRQIVTSECDTDNFEGFDNETGTVTGCYLVPNIVHFIRFNQENVTFVDAVCILAALKHQKPDKIIIHTDVPTFRGKYWKVLLDTPGFEEKLIINYIEVPTEIFGQRLSEGWRNFHGGDVARLKILMAHGGIFLDNDSYIVRSLDEFRRFEMTLGWMQNSGLANQVIIANKNARFLKEWLNSYKEYDSSKWYYNAGIKPTKEILEKRPYLIHREKTLLANHYIMHNLFMRKWPEWRTHYAIHLLINHQYMLKNISDTATYPVKFDDQNVLNYPVTFLEMAQDVYPFNESSNKTE